MYILTFAISLHLRRNTLKICGKSNKVTKGGGIMKVLFVVTMKIKQMMVQRIASLLVPLTEFLYMISRHSLWERYM